jgi:urease accessory protein
VLDGAGATGSLLRVHPGWAAGPPGPVLLGPTAALLPLAGPAIVATATAPDAATLRRQLDAAFDHCPGLAVPQKGV